MLLRIALFFVLFTVSSNLFAQKIAWEVLPDAQYSLQQVRQGNLPFKEAKTLENHAKTPFYWVRIVASLDSVGDLPAYLSMQPMLYQEWHIKNPYTQQYELQKTGLLAPYKFRVPNYVPYIFLRGRQDTLYVKASVELLQKQPLAPVLKVYWYKAKPFEESENFIWTMWWATCATMLAFFVYNFYVYLIFRDQTYLFYLVIVGSGLVYITGLNHIANLGLQWTWIRFEYLTNGRLYWYNANNLVMDLGILGVLWGFMQFTRAYLQTAYYLPAWDRFLRYVAWAYAGFMGVSMFITLSGMVYWDVEVAFINNILIVLIVLLLLGVGVLAYRVNHTLARYFLIANTLPLLLILSLAVYFAVFTFYGKGARLLPSMAIVSQALTFAVALVARINMLKEELKQKQIEAQTLQTENEQMVSRNKFIELENEYILAEIALEKNQKEELEAKLEANQRELSSNTLYLYQKNEMLSGLQKQIERLSQQSSAQHTEVIREIKATIQNNFQLEADWDKFKLHFEQVHPTFFQDLLAQCPDLTPYELRLSAYLHLNMSTKEIATLLSIAPDSVRKAKMRLNKKLKRED